MILRNRVLELKPRPDGGWDVVTEQGTIVAEHVVNAGGLWAKQVGRMAGVDLPVTPMEHHYLVTEDIPEVAALDKELGLAVDLEGFTYLRQERKGVLLGIYEQNPKHWNMDGAPWDYGIELIPEDIDRISPELTKAYERFPCLAHAGIKWVNGAFTFTPDGNPLVGPVRGLRNYWVACGVMAGFSQGGGVGKSLAEWMIEGEPQADVFGMDIARYGAFAANREYLKQTTRQFYTRRFVMTYPNERLPAGRPLKRPGAYDGMTAAGCEWASSWGWRSRLFRADGLSRGDDAEALQRLRHRRRRGVAGAPRRGPRRYLGLLALRGVRAGRGSLARPAAGVETAEAGAGEAGADAWSGRPAEGRPHRLQLGRRRPTGSWAPIICGNATCAGSRRMRRRASPSPTSPIRSAASSSPGRRRATSWRAPTHQDVSQAPSVHGLRRLDIGMVGARVARLSIAGELGFEINCPASMHAALRETLLAAGAGSRPGRNRLQRAERLRLEKSFGIWSREFTQAYTPAQTGLDRFIAFDKGDFIGRDAALKERDAGARRRLVTLEIDAVDADASGFEPVWHKGRRVGFVTSGGYGYTVGKSLALALVGRRFRRRGDRAFGAHCRRRAAGARYPGLALRP